MEIIKDVVMGAGCFALVAVLGVVSGAAYVVIGGIWAARGEGDVNGHAEKDGGAR